VRKKKKSEYQVHFSIKLKIDGILGFKTK